MELNIHICKAVYVVYVLCVCGRVCVRVQGAALRCSGVGLSRLKLYALCALCGVCGDTARTLRGTGDGALATATQPLAVCRPVEWAICGAA